MRDWNLIMKQFCKARFNSSKKLRLMGLRSSSSPRFRFGQCEEKNQVLHQKSSKVIGFVEKEKHRKTPDLYEILSIEKTIRNC